MTYTCSLFWIMRELGSFTSSETLDSWFGDEVDVRSVVCFNRHKDLEVAYQPRGTGLVEVNEISEYCKKSGNDFRGLG